MIVFFYSIFLAALHQTSWRFSFFCYGAWAIIFLWNRLLTNSLRRLNTTLTDWQLDLVFPPAVGRGARPRRRRWRQWQKGAESEKPAHLLCEHAEDRNRRRPPPRGPNAEKPRTGRTASLSSVSKPKSVFSRGGQRVPPPKDVSAPLNVDHTKLRRYDRTHSWGSSEDLCLRFSCSQPIWFGSDLVPPVKPSEPERLRPIKGRAPRRDGFGDKEGYLKFGQNASLNCWSCFSLVVKKATAAVRRLWIQALVHKNQCRVILSIVVSFVQYSFCEWLKLTCFFFYRFVLRPACPVRIFLTNIFVFSKQMVFVPLCCVWGFFSIYQQKNLKMSKCWSSFVFLLHQKLNKTPTSV